MLFFGLSIASIITNAISLSSSYNALLLGSENLPEVVIFFYSQEINSWMVEVMSLYPPEWADKALLVAKKMFDGELSFLNIGLGFVFLWWIYK